LLLHAPLRPKAHCPILGARQVAGSFLEPAGRRYFADGRSLQTRRHDSHDC